MTERRRLIKDWLDGDFDPRVWEELNHELQENDDAVREFAAEVHLHYLIRSTLLTHFGDTADNTPLLALPEEPSRPRTRSPWVAVKLVGILLLAIVGFQLLPLQPKETQAPRQSTGSANATPAAEFNPQPIAIVEMIAPGTELRMEIGKRLYPGDRLTFQGGMVRIRGLVGVVIDLSDNVDFQLVDSSKALLRSGRLTATVSEEGRGFTVTTPEASIVDLGTRFGVNVDNEGQSDVVVFHGAVDVHYSRTGGEYNRQVQRLKVGEALRLKQGARFPVIVIQKGRAPADWSTEISDSTCAIARINDNFVGLDQPTYYGVIPKGFEEDATAYVDRTYEWNSLPGIPFPEPLRGGDYVQTINNLKYVINLQIELELRLDADVYVLMDERVPTPKWLSENFERTDLRIGVDEYQPKFQPAPHTSRSLSPESMRTLGHGPGASVDASYQIWKRHARASDVVAFGGLLESVPPKQASAQAAYSIEAISMYGIVVVPSH